MKTTPDKPEPTTDAVPSATPVWITNELIDRTISVWQRFYDKPLTAEDAVGMLMRVGNLMRVVFPDAAFLKGSD